MKLSPIRSTSRSGFTLVELLVVIGIIAILAGVVSVAAGSAINAAKRAKTSAFATQIQTAVLNYYTEYGVYPTDPGDGPGDTLYQGTQADKGKWGHMAVALNGGVDPGNPSGGQMANPTIPNSRQIPFLSMSKSDLDTTAIPAVPKTAFKDGGGNPQYFFMGIDTNYNNILEAPAAPPDFAGAPAGSTTLPPTKDISGGVAVWANCDPTTNGNTTHPNFWVHTY